MKTLPSVLLGAVLLAISSVETTAQVRQPAVFENPERIVTLSPHLAELVFAAGAGDLLVGTVEYSDYPPQASSIARIGDAFRIDSEKLAALGPDLILAWPGGNPQSLIDGLRNDGYQVLELAATGLESVAIQLRRIGELTGHADRAGRAADLYLAKVDRLRVENLQKPPIRVFYQVAQRPLFTIGRKQVISEVVSLCGGINIFADLDSLAPVVSMETVLLRNPQVILSARTGSANPLDIWLDYPAVAAVRLENLYLVDASLLARAGLRLADGAAQVCRLLDQARRKIEG
ncbi:MAG: cobalamin-binding protein [Proteobacteria bacterium]|nr:cobalamin-binding protein [Pseudomonadota bacterium]MCH8221030.1 cobalamin-binding protein [Pseudomonadota bacterium]